MDKFYGYGIVDVHGSCECCFMDRDEAGRAASEFDERLQNDAPHRIVELFYKDEQS